MYNIKLLTNPSPAVSLLPKEGIPFVSAKDVINWPKTINIDDIQIVNVKNTPHPIELPMIEQEEDTPDGEYVSADKIIKHVYKSLKASSPQKEGETETSADQPSLCNRLKLCFKGKSAPIFDYLKRLGILTNDMRFNEKYELNNTGKGIIAEAIATCVLGFKKTGNGIPWDKLVTALGIKGKHNSLRTSAARALKGEVGRHDKEIGIYKEICKLAGKNFEEVANIKT